MASIASKNLYDLLGNDPEQDPDREPEPPTRALDKPVPRTGKRNAGAEGPPASAARARGGARGGRPHEQVSGSEQAFRDRGAGSYNNRANAPDDGARFDRHPDRLRRPEDGGRGRGRGRGYGGGRGGPRGGRGGLDDRHSKSGIAEHPKQAGHGWGYESGPAELTDEKAGEAIAKDEEKEGFDSTVPAPVNADGDSWAPEPTAGGDDAWAGEGGEGDADEPEQPKTKSYEEYMAELAQKKLGISDTPSVRKPNEGASKKFPEGKAFSRNEGEENFIAGTGGKAKRARDKKEKEVVDLSDVNPRQYLAEDRQAGGRGGRGGRGRGDRGDRSERGDRPDRGERGDRGERADRGDFRGRGRGRGDRARGDSFRGSRGGRGGSVPHVDDTKAFPSLGA